MSNLFETTQTLLREYKENKAEIDSQQAEDHKESRKTACVLACETILADHEEIIRSAARIGRTYTSFLTYTPYTTPEYNGFHLATLMAHNNLMAQLQKVLDTQHGEGNFKIYQLVNNKGTVRKFNICVSWDPESFSKIDEMTSRKTPTMNNNSSRPRGRPSGTERERNVQKTGGRQPQQQVESEVTTNPQQSES